MKTGIIIIFHNYENEIDKDFVVDQIGKAENLEVCLVNNNSKDNTYELLREIGEKCKNVSVLNINKFKTDVSAVRAGARFMVNQFNLKEIGYIDVNYLKTNQKELNQVLKTFFDHQESILKYKNNVNQQKRIKQSMVQSIFSLLECLKVFKKEKHVLFLQD